MSEFDAERYLRLLGERELASGADLQHAELNGRAQLAPAAAAFVACGVLDADSAGAISSDYRRADALRLGDHHRLGHAVSTAPSIAPAEPLAPRRVHALESEIHLENGRKLLLHSLTIAEDDAWLQAEIHSEVPFQHGVGAGGPALSIRTPEGKEIALGFSGGYSDHHARGRFSLQGVLDPTCSYIDVDGTRVELPPPAEPPPVLVESFGSAGVGLRYLWQLLATVGHRPQRQNIEGALAALQAAGVVAEDDAEVAAIRWVTDLQQGRSRHLRGSGAGTPPAPGVPAPWRSLLAGPRPTSGARGAIALAATTPVFDGVSIAINHLRSTAEGLAIDAETTGPADSHPGFSAHYSVPLAWWAADDRGHHYLGEIDGWSSNESGGKGEIRFGPLDPEASELTFAVTALNARALISVPLDWQV